jgi:putative DNA primase/helicase
MIGMPTGKINGVFVVDLDYDKEKGIDGRLALSQLLPVHLQTTSVLTPRGGHHYYFKMSVNVKVRNSAGQIGPGIDIRGDGGYVVVPPSTRFDGVSYSWIEPLAALGRLSSTVR